MITISEPVHASVRRTIGYSKARTLKHLSQYGLGCKGFPMGALTVAQAHTLMVADKCVVNRVDQAGWDVSAQALPQCLMYTRNEEVFAKHGITKRELASLHTALCTIIQTTGMMRHYPLAHWLVMAMGYSHGNAPVRAGLWSFDDLQCVSRLWAHLLLKHNGYI